ncbi:MAG TPA: carboxylesterase family protein [Kofleriaceae bacterium]|jgi:para-nitrobenzyl esterase|nr:carboxylesterase family protein [Kofleriaceae bacterium]
MDRHRETFSTCARLLLIGLLASCASLDTADPESADAADAAAAAAADATPRVAEDHAAFAVTEEGLVRGVATDTTRVFRGIPYAAPPVGNQRWRPPQRAARHRGILDATRFANHCPQVAGAFGQGSTTEDCLFLNVFIPNPLHGRNRDLEDFGLHPVMVWIHGGALVTGESDDYDATRLVEQGDVIVVTINYRLGELGFLAHPALTAESPDHASGNYGLLDQQEALRWVRRNILLFGGNPDRVTIFGESAGGLSVHSQLASPGSAGLFQRAIVESGAYQLTQPTLAAAEATGAAFATAAGCTDQTATCLRGLTVDQILAAQPGGVGGASPTIDNKFLTQSVGAAFTSGQFNRVPILEGANHDEWRLFVGITELQTGAPLPAAAYPAAIQATLGVPAAVVPLFVAQYPLASFSSPSLALSALGSDGIFDCNARFVEQKVSQFVPTFAYEFSDPSAPERFLPPVSFPYAAAHASEIQFVFDLPVTVPAPGLDANQQKLAATMVSYWTTFARTGQPNSRGVPAFPAFQTASDTAQSLVPPAASPETGFAAAHHCAFWDSLRR